MARQTKAIVGSQDQTVLHPPAVRVGLRRKAKGDTDVAMQARNAWRGRAVPVTWIRPGAQNRGARPRQWASGSCVGQP